MLPRLNKDGRTQPYTEKHGDLRRKKTACFRAYTDSVFIDLEIQENVMLERGKCLVFKPCYVVLYLSDLLSFNYRPKWIHED